MVPEQVAKPQRCDGCLAPLHEGCAHGLSVVGWPVSALCPHQLPGTTHDDTPEAVLREFAEQTASTWPSGSDTTCSWCSRYMRLKSSADRRRRRHGRKHNCPCSSRLAACPTSAKCTGRSSSVESLWLCSSTASVRVTPCGCKPACLQHCSCQLFARAQTQTCVFLSVACSY